MFLTEEEFGWLERWVAVMKKVSGPKNDFVLYTKGKLPSKNLNTYMRTAWADMGLKSEISFTLIRSAVSS